MKRKFNEVATNIPVASGWSVRKVVFAKDDPVVQLQCSHATQGDISVKMDLDKGEFTSSFPQPFTRNPPEQLAQKIRSAITPPKP